MVTVFMLLAIYNKPRLTLEEVAHAIGISVPTAYTWRSLGKMPVPMSGNPLTADIRDVSDCLDKLREEGRAKADAIAKMVK